MTSCEGKYIVRIIDWCKCRRIEITREIPPQYVPNHNQRRSHSHALELRARTSRNQIPEFHDDGVDLMVNQQVDQYTTQYLTDSLSRMNLGK